ncbi:MAG: tRNA uridine(34) 5-carboxymethylaminomethyl modification radical SAM/GNAT enzyme Elp3 [Halobacteriota archaeon]|nr:tRNA uridine(34) 5-carboxymethylaminomethyl modification radical SAM/GNAT enzyme Elp3 [Halobacteriota archaeon]
MTDDYDSACTDLAELLINSKDDFDLAKAKKRVSARYGLCSIPKNSDILAKLPKDEKIIKKVQRKPVRTISGVAVVAVMTSPSECPHGRCMMCPGGPKSDFNSPQSYVGAEPAALRGVQLDYDPFQQVTFRLRQMEQIGHRVDKAELIIMGGTMTSRPPSYQEWFVKRCLDAMNYYDDGIDYDSQSINEAQHLNEFARVRNVAITFETRPDHVSRGHIDGMLGYGVTKVELGIQHTYDRILEMIERGHTRADAQKANKLLRDSSFKVGFHMMPGLPGSSIDDDLKMFEGLFKDPDLKPDYLKIYPTLVTEGTKLYDCWKAGDYKPLSNEEAADLVARIKKILPRWVRLQRVQRDIPAKFILDGVNKSNLRQLARKRLDEMGGKCNCIRCREVGYAQLRGEDPGDVKLSIESYEACCGIEHFISYEDPVKGILIGFLKLRFPGSTFRQELEGATLIRDLHVYGEMMPLEGKGDQAWQHRGYGKMLLEQAVELSRSEGFEKIAIISGIGVREYYRKLGYQRDGPYMSKDLK